MKLHGALRLGLALLFSCGCTHSFGLSLDEQLQLVIQVHKLSPARCTVDENLIDEKLTPIGELVFTTNILSGDRDISCSTCHLDEAALTDGLPFAVGVGGVGEGPERLYSDGVIVPRNAFTLFGRAQKDYTTFFWDGKVLEQDGKLFSPIGEGYAQGFNSSLAVAAVLPILARDEFLGKQRILDDNLHLRKIDTVYYQDKIIAANAILAEVLNSNEIDAVSFKMAFKGSDAPHLNIVLVGNALASFIATKVQQDCVPSPWEEYLSGSEGAITDTQKKGALLFYGKGRCAGCHSGNLQTDFQFHSIGAPQGKFGTHLHGQDIGRAGVTYEIEDRYEFRTPPLFYVSETAPYGHNGTFQTLEEIVTFHLNPLLFFEHYQWTSDREKYSYNKILASRSLRLGFIEITSPKELEQLLEFLKAL